MAMASGISWYSGAAASSSSVIWRYSPRASISALVSMTRLVRTVGLRSGGVGCGRRAGVGGASVSPPGERTVSRRRRVKRRRSPMAPLASASLVALASSAAPLAPLSGSGRLMRKWSSGPIATRPDYLMR